MLCPLVLLFSIALASCHEVYFSETFPNENSIDNWVSSTFKGEQQGEFKISPGDSPVDPVEDLGLKTTVDARFYGITSKIPKPFSNKGKTLVVQFTVKYDKTVDCGGAYIKILGSNVDQTKFHGETPYKIMFGPDICGMSTKKVHVIFNYKGKNHLIKKNIPCKDDLKTHLYTLVVKPDNTYTVLIDNKVEESGSLEDDWDMLPPKKIDDPNVKKPTDWVEEEMMDDPDDKKPEDWDQPEKIPDPNATKPEDWDDEMDGEWVPPQISNPDFKGTWYPKRIKNPAYKGPWVPPQIDNPEYSHDSELYAFDDIAHVGFDLWQVASGSIFDNILITDSEEFAKEEGERLWRKRYDAEKIKEDEKSKAEAAEAKDTEEPVDEPEEESPDTTEEASETSEKRDEL